MRVKSNSSLEIPPKTGEVRLVEMEVVAVMKKNKSFFFVFRVVLALFPHFANAQTDTNLVFRDSSGQCSSSPEICGDGIDQDCNGSDLACSGTDKDLDGFAAGLDCDDSNRYIYPGISRACMVSGTRGTQTCSNGAFTACSTTPLCEAVASGRCFYISSTTGNDENAGTFTAPWKTFNRFSFRGDSGYVSNRVTLLPGDVIYFMGGLYTDSNPYENKRNGMFFYGVNGQSGAPITLKAYPGTTPILSPSDRARGVRIQNSSYIVLEGIEIANAYYAGARIISSSNVEMRNMWIHGTDGVDNDNIAGISAVDTTYINIHHSLIHDNYDRTCADTGGNKTENSRNVVLFEGGFATVKHNVIFQTPPSNAQRTGSCIVYKHGALAAGSIFEVANNTFRNCYFTAIGNGGPGGRFHHNRIFDSDDAVTIKDHGGAINLTDNIFELNTVVRSSGVKYNPSEAYEQAKPYGNLTIRRNVFIDKAAFYNTDIGGITKFNAYGNNIVYNDVMNRKLLSLTGNCYFNPNTTVRFGLFSDNSTAERNLGGLYTFSEWQSRGFDTGSIVADPNLDASSIPQNASCSTMGYQAN